MDTLGNHYLHPGNLYLDPGNLYLHPGNLYLDPGNLSWTLGTSTWTPKVQKVMAPDIPKKPQRQSCSIPLGSKGFWKLAALDTDEPGKS